MNNRKLLTDISTSATALCARSAKVLVGIALLSLIPQAKAADVVTSNVEYDRYGRLVNSTPLVNGKSETVNTAAGDIQTTESKYITKTVKTLETNRLSLFKSQSTLSATNCESYLTVSYCWEENGNGGIKWLPKGTVTILKTQENEEYIQSITKYEYARQDSGAVTTTVYSGFGTVVPSSTSVDLNVTSGTKTTIVTNDYGYVTSSTISDIQSDAIINSTTMPAGDHFTSWGQPEKFESTLGLETTYEFDEVTGLVEKVTDYLNNKTEYTYESLHGAVTETTFTPVQGKSITTINDVSNPLKTQTTTTITGAATRSYVANHNNLGVMMDDISEIAGFDNAKRTRFRKDFMGGMESSQFGVTSEHKVDIATGESTTVESNGDPFAINNMQGNDQEYTYENGFLVFKANQNSNHNPNKTITSIDGYGRVREVKVPSPASTDTIVSYITYETNYTFGAKASNCVISASPATGAKNGKSYHIVHSEPYYNKVGRQSRVRSGIDIDNNEGLDKEIDRFVTNLTTISKSGGYAKVAQYVETLEGNYTESTSFVRSAKGKSKTTVNVNGESITETTNEYLNRKIITVTLRGAAELARNEVEMNYLMLPTSSTFTGVGMPTSTSEITRRGDGTVSKSETTVGTYRDYSSNYDNLGFRSGRSISPYTSIDHIEDTINKTTGQRIMESKVVGENSPLKHTVSVDGLVSNLTGPNVVDKKETTTPSANGTGSELQPNEASGAATNFSSNAAGMPVSKTYANGKKIISQYYNHGGICSVQDSRMGAAGSQKIVYGYTPNSALDLSLISYPTINSGLKDGHQVRFYYRDSDGKMERQEDLSGVRDFHYSKNRAKKVKYSGGALKGVEFKHSYDQFGRHTSSELLIGNNSINKKTLNYSGVSDQISSISHTKGANVSYGYSSNLQQLNSVDVSISVSGGTNGFTRDYQLHAAGRLEGITTTGVSGVPNYTFTDFDARSRRKKMQTEGGEWSYTYDDNGSLTQAAFVPDSGSTVDHGTFGYTTDGMRRWTQKAVNGVNYNVDSVNNLNQIASFNQEASFDLWVSATPGSQLSLNGYAIPNNGFQEKLSISGTIYDAVMANGGVYELLGVLSGEGDTNAHPDAQSFLRGIASQHRPAQVSLQFDTEGNIKSDANFFYYYNAKNQQVCAESKDYSDTNKPGCRVDNFYSESAQRFKKVCHRRYRNYVSDRMEEFTTTTWFVYDGWELVYERVEPGNQLEINNAAPLLERFYSWGLDLDGSHGGLGGVGGMVSYKEVVYTSSGSNAETYMPTYDPQGNVVALVRASDNVVVANYVYGPFGELINAEGPKAQSNPWRFATKYQEPETGYYYFGYRYYDPIMGRWLSREPLGEGEAINLYSYCGNDPVNKVDLLGLADELLDKLMQDKPLKMFDPNMFKKTFRRECGQEMTDDQYRACLIRSTVQNVKWKMRIGYYENLELSEFERTLKHSRSLFVRGPTWEETKDQIFNYPGHPTSVGPIVVKGLQKLPALVETGKHTKNVVKAARESGKKGCKELVGDGIDSAVANGASYVKQLDNAGKPITEKAGLLIVQGRKELSLIGHGDTGIFGYFRKFGGLSNKKLINVIEEFGKGYDTVNLYICKAGKYKINGAQHIANTTNKTVVAASRNLTMTKNGPKVRIGGIKNLFKKIYGEVGEGMKRFFPTPKK